MRALLTGYAGAFNRRHHRSGHLFQNRYRLLVVEEEPYFLELVRYIHLVPPPRQNDSGPPGVGPWYPWTGHSALLETVPRPWQETELIRVQFGPTGGRARKAYQAFVAAGVPKGRRPELQGGGLVRSAGGWTELVALRRTKEAVAGDARVLGGGDFVERLWREVQDAQRLPPSRPTLESVIARVCQHTATTIEELAGGSRRPAVTRTREGIAHLWVGALGQSGRRLASVLGVAPQSVYRAAARGGCEGRRVGTPPPKVTEVAASPMAYS